MGMVRSPKSISGAVGLALGNAPYKIGDRTGFNVDGFAHGNKRKSIQRLSYRI